MKSMVKKAFTKNIAFAMITITLLIISNNIFFLHTHVLDDGSIVFHAHPFKKGDNDNGENHHHSTYEYIFFKQFQQLLNENFSNYAVIIPLVNFKFYYSCSNYITTNNSTFFKRGPPHNHSDILINPVWDLNLN
jgi:hypothetical protein